MRRTSFFIKFFPLFLIIGTSITLSGNTMVNEYGVGVNGVKTTFEIKKYKDLKANPFSIDFQKMLELKEEIILNPKETKDPIEILKSKVVIDDVVVFLDADMKMEGMMVYNTATSSPIGQADYLPSYSPG